MRISFILFCLLSFYTGANAQQIPLNQAVQNRLNQLLIHSDTSIFTGFRAMNWMELQPLGKLQKTDLIDSAFGIASPGSKASFQDRVITDNWIKIGKGNSVLTLDPYLEGSYGRTSANGKKDTLTSGAVGVRLQAVINRKFTINADFAAYSNEFPLYVDSVIFNTDHIVPGNNKATLIDNHRWNYNNGSFNITYTPSTHFLASAGFGKQFLGDGYRSLQLSDNAFNYPYLRLQARFWKLTYNVLYNRYENKDWYKVDGKSQGKFSVIHQLGVNLGKKFQFALFDQVIFIAKDTNFNRGFDVTYLNPLIFLRPTEFSIGSPDNALIGLSFKYSLYKKGFVYGQLALDDLNLQLSKDHKSQFYGNKYALQAGIWNNDLFGVKNLSWRLEWNGVRPYTYGHGIGNNRSLNDSHYFQSVTDPFGANFHEFISIFNYSYDRWYGFLQNLYTIRGEGNRMPGALAGDNIFADQNKLPANASFGTTTLQGSRHNYFYNQLTAGYLINPRNRLGAEVNVVYHRRTGVDVHQSEFMFSLGIKTTIFNSYYDY